MQIGIIIAPILGGIIGYITNDIAIKMLFRPRKAIYIGKFRLPFTPGLIPQQKNRVARSIGNVISTQLLDAETIKNTVVSENIVNTIYQKLEDAAKQFENDTRTVKEFACQYAEADKIEAASDKLSKAVSDFIISKISEADIGTEIVKKAIDGITGKLGGGMMGTMISGDLTGQIEGALGSVINEKIMEEAPSIIETEILKLGDGIMRTRLCDLYDKYRDKIPVLIGRVMELYKKIVGENIKKVISALDIAEIVYNKVAEFDAAELEKMIFGIMKKELRAIVYLGALLGFLLGFINVLLL